MRTSTSNYIKDLLSDYPKMAEYIQQREKELQAPYARTEYQEGQTIQAERMVITISVDRRLRNLEINRKIIADILEASDETTNHIIEELYFKPRPQFNMVGIAQKLFISKNSAYRLHNHFFEKLANELGLD